MIKQVIAVRKDLNMRKGKIAAQVAHASLKVWFDRMIPGTPVDSDQIISYRIGNDKLTPEMIEWKENAFTKIVVGAKDEDHIYSLAHQAKEADIPYAIIIDNGMTEFAGNKTTTCIAIGPADSEKIDLITGKLALI
jgi:PTH2 family peptidyl-tRNA hydrolase